MFIDWFLHGGSSCKHRDSDIEKGSLLERRMWNGGGGGLLYYYHRCTDTDCFFRKELLGGGAVMF